MNIRIQESCENIDWQKISNSLKQVGMPIINRNCIGKLSLTVIP